MPDGVIVEGERWFPSPASFAEDMPDAWGDWGVDSEVGTLRAVLMRRPGPEIENIGAPGAFRFAGQMDPVKAQEQHDALVEIYREHGVRVYYVENMRPDRPNGVYVRDLVFMTPQGAILARPGISARRGEERYAAEALARLGVPIIHTVCGEGTFEGACATWVDRETVIIGTSSRCNAAGAAQVEATLRAIGVKTIIPFQIPFGSIHIDGILNIADRRKAMIFPWQTPYDVARALLDKGFTLLENPHIEEIKIGHGLNFVALEPGKVVMPAGNPLSRRVLEDGGIEVIEADISELMKGRGAIHCMTAFLKRDPIGTL